MGILSSVFTLPAALSPSNTSDSSLPVQDALLRSEDEKVSSRDSFRSYYPYGLNVVWKGESVLSAFKQKSEDSLYIPNFDKSIDNSNNIRLARISKAKRRKRVTRDMSTLKNSILELAVINLMITTTQA
ncbi:uncharacterized protein TNCV_3012681 [Trichonephila clavipes]|nr:uncharacterized protein TNCV_3012681 [Trichonephila clavipes]